jgi:chromosomal replication initiation ATPase DnaA
MNPEERAGLERLAQRLGSRAASVWLRDARLEIREEVRILRVAGAYPRRRLEERAALLREALGGPVVVVGDEPARPARRARATPCLRGPGGEFALRIVRAFVEGGPATGPLTVLHGAAGSGKSVLVDWACAAAAGAAFRLDMARLRSGRSRGLVPRKPLVVADRVEDLAGREKSQRTFCTILDAVRDRGHRLLCTLEGHPGHRPGIFPALRNRLLGGILVPLEAEDPAVVLARRSGRRPGPPAPAGRPALDLMKDAAARLFGVERALLEGGTKRRGVVEARRTVLAAACRAGMTPAALAAAFGLRSDRAVREACRWAAREVGRDGRYAALLHEVGRVVPRP